MEALASPLSKRIFVERGGRATSGSSFEALSRRRWRRTIQLLQTSAEVCSEFSVFLPLKRTIVRSASPFSSLSAESEANAETVDSLIPSSDKSKTVHVKFMLQKACLYGQQFLLVGEDPIFGLWDPSSAIPLEWSDDHIWTVELDLPAGKSIKFKFILRELSGDITWQPGPDRVLRTWETTNMIIVSENWNNAEHQEITEESLAITSGQMISSVSKMGTNGAVLTDENQMDMIDESLMTMKYEENKLMNCDGNSILVPGLTPVPPSATEEVLSGVFPEEVMNGRVDNSSRASDEASSSIAEMDMIDESLMTMKYEENKPMNCDGDQILVPGLTPVPPSVTEEVFPEEVMNGRINNSSRASSDVANCSIAECKPMTPKGSQHEEITIELETSHSNDPVEVRPCDDELLEEKHQSIEENGSQPEVEALGNDFLWGRKTLHKLLLKLGLSEHGST